MACFLGMTQHQMSSEHTKNQNDANKYRQNQNLLYKFYPATSSTFTGKGATYLPDMHQLKFQRK